MEKKTLKLIFSVKSDRMSYIMAAVLLPLSGATLETEQNSLLGQNIMCKKKKKKMEYVIKQGLNLYW